MRNRPRGAATYGIDIGKHRFDVVAVDATGAVIQRAKFRRDTLLAHFVDSAEGAYWHGNVPRLAMARSTADRDGS